MIISPSIFKNYDIRGIIPDELDIDGVKRIIQATAAYFRPSTVCLGYDARKTSRQISQAAREIFLANGIDVVSLGMVTTDMITFASGKFEYDLSIMITASHNPSSYNGFKMATKGGISVSGQTGFYQIRDLVLSNKEFNFNNQRGKLIHKNIYQDWIDFCFSLADLTKIKKMRVVIDAANGAGGKLFGHDYLTNKLPVEIIPLYFQPDGDFPNHLPNPLKSENLEDLRKKVKKESADFGIALDGDGDRIGFITSQGKFITGTVATAIIAKNLLQKSPGEMVLYNAVCGRVVPEVVKKSGGRSKRVRVGYSLIKKEMQEEKAIFAGEHSCHYFYRHVYNSEASLLTFLLILEEISGRGLSFTQMVDQIDKYPQSGEINFEVEDKEEVMKEVEELYKNKAKSIDWLDGISIWFEDWWANIRPSNTQPLLRLNLEADNKEILTNKTKELISLIESLGGRKSNQ